jgi:hypothetical protein
MGFVPRCIYSTPKEVTVKSEKKEIDFFTWALGEVTAMIAMGAMAPSFFLPIRFYA